MFSKQFTGLLVVHGRLIIERFEFNPIDFPINPEDQPPAIPTEEIPAMIQERDADG